MEKMVALVTGANRGIGFEVTRQLLELGYIVIMGSRDEKKGEAALLQLSSEGHKENLTLVQLDVSSDDSVAEAYKEIRHQFDHLDVLINNAGVLYDDWQTLSDMDLKDAFTAMNTNCFGAVRVTNAFLPLIKKSKRGRIVNVSSGSGALSSMSPRTPAYNLSKVSMNALTRMYAEELRSHDILVNSVCPGWTFTDMGKGGRPVAEGAKSVLWAVKIHDDGPTGGFFRDGKPIAW